MSKIEKFEDLQCWQEARKWTKSIYKALANCRDYSFRDQIQRASVSVMNNIAEGFSRFTTKDTIQFFNIAIASLSEVRSMIYLAYDLEYISKEVFNQLLEHNQTIQNITLWFLKYLHTYKKSST
jgi:four helix bundle protein